MSEIVLTLALAGALALYGVESRAWRSERARLLDRIMARNYNEFVHTATVTTVATPQMITDEAEAAWAAQHTEAADTAWHEENKRLHPEQYPDEAA